MKSLLKHLNLPIGIVCIMQSVMTTVIDGLRTFPAIAFIVGVLNIAWWWFVMRTKGA